MFGMKSREVRAAERRWTRNNEENRRAGCSCGKPAETFTAYYEVTGDVPFKWWTCLEHQGASGFSNGIALYEHGSRCPEGQTMSEGGKIDQPPTRFSCPHRFH